MASPLSPGAKVTAMLGTDPEAFQTPCYVYDVTAVAAAFTALKAALGTRLVVSFKANPCTDIQNRCQTTFADGTEVASIGELTRTVGGEGGPRYVNNPSAGKELLRAAVASRATIIVDSLAQLDALIATAAGRPVQPLILRLNASVLREVQPDHPPVRDDHFGMDLATVAAAVARAREAALEIRGFHLFKGSHTFAVTAMATAAAAGPLLARLEALLGHPATYLNLGGGFAERWAEASFDFAAYRSALARLPPHVTLAHEAGRALFGTAGVFLARVVFEKCIADRRYFVLDGGMAQSFLLARTESRLSKLRTPLVVPADAGPRDPLAAPAALAGSTCSKDDLVGMLPAGTPAPAPGDVLVFEDCGAYHSTYTPSKFLTLAEAKEYIIV